MPSSRSSSNASSSVCGRGRDGHVQAAHLVDRVVVDLREDDLLADAHRVVAAAVEGARVEAPEVPDPRDRDRLQAVEHLPHAVAAQRHLDAHRHALAQLEVGDRLARTADMRLLPGDDGELLRRVVEQLGVELGVADAHVERDLLQARRLHRALVAEALDQLGLDLAAGSAPSGVASWSSASSRIASCTRSRLPVVAALDADARRACRPWGRRSSRWRRGSGPPSRSRRRPGRRAGCPSASAGAGGA